MFYQQAKTEPLDQGWANVFTGGSQWVLIIDREAGPAADG